MARVHYAWVVAGVAFATLVAAAAFRAAPGVLMVPLHAELGWSIVTMSAAVSVNLVLYGLTAPFAAALMERFGLRRVTSAGLLLIAAGAGLSVFAQAAWQLVFTWGVLIGLGTGSMALIFAATVANAWFVKRRGLVIGVLTAGGAAGQLVFLPVVAFLAKATSWEVASLLIAAAAVAVLPLVAVLLRDRPSDLGLAPYGGNDLVPPPPPTRRSAAGLALEALRQAARTKAFWALAGAFAICGATTNGLIGIHFIPSAHDHGMATTTAAGLLTVVGLFDIVGTVVSGWLTDRIDPRWLLLVYYTFRGVGLMLLPWLLADTVHLSMVAFIVVYGLDWVATVPPTVVLCRRLFGDRGTIVFGWVFASHQLGAAAAALAAGFIRDSFGTYTYAWFGGAALCAVAALLSISLRSISLRSISLGSTSLGSTSLGSTSLGSTRLGSISLGRQPDATPITDERDKDAEAEAVSDLTP